MSAFPTTVMISHGGVSVAFEHPPEEQRVHYNTGDHRLVKAWQDGGEHAGAEHWMCFDHGWPCWASTAAQNADPDCEG